MSFLGHVVARGAADSMGNLRAWILLGRATINSYCHYRSPYLDRLISRYGLVKDKGRVHPRSSIRLMWYRRPFAQQTTGMQATCKYGSLMLFYARPFHWLARTFRTKCTSRAVSLSNAFFRYDRECSECNNAARGYTIRKLILVIHTLKRVMLYI